MTEQQKWFLWNARYEPWVTKRFEAYCDLWDLRRYDIDVQRLTVGDMELERRILIENLTGRSSLRYPKTLSTVQMRAMAMVDWKRKYNE